MPCVCQVREYSTWKDRNGSGRHKGGSTSAPRETGKVILLTAGGKVAPLLRQGNLGQVTLLICILVRLFPNRGVEVDQILFIPLEPSCTNFDNLMEQTSHLVSLIRFSVHRLAQLDLLQQSIARFSDAPQFSGLVSISFWIPKYELCIIIFLK
jgi:hypothetical protein